MNKRLTGLIHFPANIESNLFYSALATLMLYLENINEDTPFYCGKQKAYCFMCGDCGDLPNINKHHLQQYGKYITMSGVSLMWQDDYQDDGCRTPYQTGILPTGLTDRIDCLMRVAGYGYERLDKQDGKEKVFTRICQSIDQDRPALMKLGTGRDWDVVTGYDTEGMVLYGLDAKNYGDVVSVLPDGYTPEGEFYTSGWFDRLDQVILITSTGGKELPFEEIVARMIAELEHTKTAEEKLRSGYQALNKDNVRDWADLISRYTDYLAERRWQAAECINETLLMKTDHPARRALLEEGTLAFLRTHDLCWEIWSYLGKEECKGFRLPEDVDQRVLAGDNANKLHQLCDEVVEKDWKVKEILERCLQTVSF